MPSALALLSGAHLLMLSAFVGATSVAMLVAVLGRLRIPRTLCVWRHGRFTALPLGPLLFLLATAAAFIGASWEGHALPPHVLIGYPAGGVFWTIATWLVRSVVITEYGLVTDIYRLRDSR
jgi:hypothetical protein